MKLIFTGTGRSGTGYCKEVTNKLGVKCGHENVFTPFGISQTDLIADSSWLAVPHLENYKDALIVLVYREPSSVIKSFTKRKFFDTPSVWRNYMNAHNKEIEMLSGLEAANCHYQVWNEMASKNADIICTPSTIPWEVITSHLGTAYDKSIIDSVPTNFNTDPGPQVTLTEHVFKKSTETYDMLQSKNIYLD